MPEEIRQLVSAGEGLFPVEFVGLGCTSIAREVLQNWPKGVPIFRNEYTNARHILVNSYGEVSHDAWFCKQVRKQGYSIYLDPSIRLGHLSKVKTTLETYAAYHSIAVSGAPEAGADDLVEEVELPVRA